ncbi:hypothetical protein ABIB90_006676 [Bradyrhizobium sp. JR4.1]|jgi:hypothetical protein
MSPRARFDLPAQLFALDEVISCAGNTSNRPLPLTRCSYVLVDGATAEICR